MSALTVVTDLPASVSTGKRGRPALFSPEKQAEVKALTAGFALLQENVKGRSRVTALRKQHEGFVFRAVVTGHAERVNRAGETVTDEIVAIYVAPETYAAPTKTQRGKAKPAAAE